MSPRIVLGSLVALCLAWRLAVLIDAKTPTSTRAAQSAPPGSIGELIEETGFYQSIRLEDTTPLYVKQSQYQRIEVHKSSYYGRILVLDGVVQLTERDADSYNEMMAHIPMFQHAEPHRVLVIGGGDGYVVSELLKHDAVTHVDHVDLDGDVIATCRTYFPAWSHAGRDPRVHVHVTDGAAFVRAQSDASYDVVIQDSSDPWTWNEHGDKVDLPSSVLYSPEHFAHIHRILKPNGILNIQAESLQIPSDIRGVRAWRQLALRVGFDRARYGSVMISSYPTGQIGFLLCEKRATAASSMSQIEERYMRMVLADKNTSYYHPPQQTHAFVLPLWAHQHIYDESPLWREEL